MQKNKALSIFSVLLIGMMAISPLAHASNGASLFQQHCSRCHQSATRIKTPPDQIPGVISRGTIRQHRFTLDAETLQTIVTYIKQQQS